MSERGKFISLEGIDGVGKSTHMTFIADYLRGCGKKVVTTREPGGTEFGEKFRDLLLHSRGMHRITELLLLFASRQELIHNLVLPNLEKGVWIVSDRFIDASIAYQGVGRGIGVETVKQLANILEPKLITDLTLLFDTKLDIAIARINKSRNKDRIEKENKLFFTKVQKAYYDILEEEPNRMKLIMTDQDIEQTRDTIISHLDNLIDAS